MKILKYFLIILLFVALGYTFYLNFKPKLDLKSQGQKVSDLSQKKLNDANKQSSTFEQKIKCESLRSDLVTRIANEYKENTFPNFKDASLVQLFYSPKSDSCLYVMKWQYQDPKEYSLVLADILKPRMTFGESANIKASMTKEEQHKELSDFWKFVQSYQ